MKQTRMYNDDGEGDNRRSSSGGRGGFGGGRSSSGRSGGFNRGGNSGGRGGFGGGRSNFNNGPPKEMHKAVCSKCKKECEVPFKPTEGRDVFCRECFNNRD